MADLVSVLVEVYGLVQGVFFRDSVLRQARELEITGYVRNLPDGRTVEVTAEGERNRLEKLIDYLRVGPSRASVDRLDVSWSDYTGNYPRFEIKH